jgi:hypothetical protein
MEPARLIFRARRNLFVGPGAMRNGTFQQGTVLKLVTENRFQQVKVRKCDPLCLQDICLTVIKPEASSKLATKLPAIERRGLGG